MPLVFAAISPHSPALLPGLASSKRIELNLAVVRAQALAKSLTDCNPEAVIIISPHGPVAEAKVLLNIGSQFTADFEQLGDMATKFKLNSAYELADALYRQCSDDCKLVNEDSLDYGIAAPLAHLDHEANFSLLPIYPSNLQNYEQFNFGFKLAKFLQSRLERIAFIASGELSQKLTKKSPGGFSKDAKKFDEQIVDAVKNKDLNKLNYSPEQLTEIGQCGFSSIAIFMAAISKYELKCQKLDYEAPVGVGWLTARYL